MSICASVRLCVQAYPVCLSVRPCVPVCVRRVQGSMALLISGLCIGSSVHLSVHPPVDLSSCPFMNGFVNPSMHYCIDPSIHRPTDAIDPMDPSMPSTHRPIDPIDSIDPSMPSMPPTNQCHRPIDPSMPSTHRCHRPIDAIDPSINLSMPRMRVHK